MRLAALLRTCVCVGVFSLYETFTRVLETTLEMGRIPRTWNQLRQKDGRRKPAAWFEASEGRGPVGRGNKCLDTRGRGVGSPAKCRECTDPPSVYSKRSSPLTAPTPPHTVTFLCSVSLPTSPRGPISAPSAVQEDTDVGCRF